MVQIESPAANLSLIGGILCLDFANTVGDHAGEHPHELLRTYDDLLAWSLHAGMLDGELVDALHERAAQRPDRAQAELRRAIELREAIYAIFTACATGEAVDDRQLATINQELTLSLTRLQLVPCRTPGPDERLIRLPADSPSTVGSRKKTASPDDSPPPAFQLVWPVHELDLGLPRWPIVYSAAKLLASSGLDRVRQCAGDDCGWLFLDTSRNHSRRWCDMADCGNRAKARRHYRRTRSEANTV